MSILTELQEAFPKCWFKDGKEFDGGSATVWSGEGSEIEDFPAFDSYAEDWDGDRLVYRMGVLVTLDDFVTEAGYRWEAYDAGTYLLYKD